MHFKLIQTGSKLKMDRLSHIKRVKYSTFKISVLIVMISKFICTAKTQLEKQQTTSLISQKPRWRFSLTFVLLFCMYLETIEKVLRFYMIILVYHLWVENTYFVRVFSSHLAQGMQNIYWRVFSNTFKWLLKKEQFKTMELTLTPSLDFKIGANSSSAYKNTTDHSYILEKCTEYKNRSTSCPNEIWIQELPDKYLQQPF